MHPAVPFLVALLGAFLLWTLIGPRSQWQVFVGWTRSSPRDSEPSQTAYTTARLLAGVGVVVLGSLVGSWAIGYFDATRPATRGPSTLVERVWGLPSSLLVDRVFTPLSVVPEGMADAPVLGYQSVLAASRLPASLWEFEPWAAGDGAGGTPTDVTGLIGVAPLEGTSAIDTADLVVQVHTGAQCIPQQVVVVTTDETVQVGVYVARPTAADGTPAAGAAACADAFGAPEASYLVPIALAEPLGSRTVIDMTGASVDAVTTTG